MIIENIDSMETTKQESKQFHLLMQAKYMGSYTAYMGLQPACALRVASEYYSPTAKGWTAELASGLWSAVSATGFEPMRIDPIRFEPLRLNQSATPCTE